MEFIRGSNLVGYAAAHDLSKRQRLELVAGDSAVESMNVVVGKTATRTPLFQDTLEYLVVNPYWNAPESIVRKDIIPLMRENPNYLRDNAIRLIDSSGNEVDPMTIDWSTDEAARLRFRQDPGRINAMASVKIDFPNPHAVYMHDTPSTTRTTRPALEGPSVTSRRFDSPPSRTNTNAFPAVPNTASSGTDTASDRSSSVPTR